MSRRSRYGLIVPLIFLMTVSSAGQTELAALQAALTAAYQGKLVHLKVFPASDSVRFDPSGKVVGKARAGSWTLHSAVVLTAVTLKRDQIVMDGFRVVYRYDAAGGRLSPSATPEKRSLKLDLPSGQLTPTTIQEVLGKVFIGPEGLVDYVPDHWKRYVLRATGASTQKFECDHNPTLATVLGRAPTPLPANRGATAVITQAKLLKKIQPKFSKEALQYGISGIIGLDGVISKAGDVIELHVAHGLGAGLDENAIDAVRQWKYSPTLSDGRPVEVLTCFTVAYQ